MKEITLRLTDAKLEIIRQSRKDTSVDYFTEEYRTKADAKTLFDELEGYAGVLEKLCTPVNDPLDRFQVPASSNISEPLSVVLPPNMAAAARFLALIHEQTPEELVLCELAEPFSVMVNDRIWRSDEGCKRWLYPRSVEREHSVLKLEGKEVASA